MTLAKVQTRTIPRNSKELREIVLIPYWSRHSFREEIPTEGISCDNKEVRERYHQGRFLKCYEILDGRGEIIFMATSSLWFSTDSEVLRVIKKRVARERARDRMEYFFRHAEQQEKRAKDEQRKDKKGLSED